MEKKEPHMVSRRHSKYVYEELERKEVKKMLPRTKMRLWVRLHGKTDLNLTETYML